MSIVPLPDFRLTIDGKDVSPKIRPRLSALSLTEARGEEADTLEITLDDSDHGLALPPIGATITLQLGWARGGGGVTAGLVEKGRFVIDTLEHGGPPDQLIVRARAADMTGALTTRRETSWRATTLGQVVADIAGRNGLTPRCAASLAGVPVSIVAQSRESDMALLRRLGRAHDAVATIKHGALILAPTSAGVTATGQALPSMTIRRSDGDRYGLTIERKEAVTGVTAAWHDLGAARRHLVHAGGEGRRKRLARVHASEAEARAAAEAEHARLARATRTLRFDLALGRPELAPEQRVTPRGFRPEIDARPWLITRAVHMLAEGGALLTTLEMEGVS
ncbi:contractile injection system protein, VgrG/Pvc8 family [Sphingomonas morindae]|uniref:Phage late control D family protein n=1 Tax=Sphingomonas morindae TaxID=1541170 RepID=A0ABY4X728_9SPHN|nr:contractile injection system protein, VgrG/Pvc8 family [Sphingomonas morindae]USI72696.1 phage late control D family protein [Sphingomonas morindae]